MPTKTEWKRVHAGLMAQLRLPCGLKFSSAVKVGQHTFDDDSGCFITVNPEVDFRVPEHLLLHEAAHHRICDGIMDNPTEDNICHTGWGGHCEHWAHVLCAMYEETGIALPKTTSFIEFAKAAGITRKNFVQED